MACLIISVSFKQPENCLKSLKGVVKISALKVASIKQSLVRTVTGVGKIILCHFITLRMISSKCNLRVHVILHNKWSLYRYFFFNFMVTFSFVNNIISTCSAKSTNWKSAFGGRLVLELMIYILLWWERLVSLFQNYVDTNSFPRLPTNILHNPKWFWSASLTVLQIFGNSLFKKIIHIFGK